MLRRPMTISICGKMLILCVLGLLINVCYSQEEHISKRLLLSDPDYLQNELNNLKTEIADMKSKLLSEEAETAALKSQMTSEQTAMANLKSQMTSEQAELTALKSQMTSVQAVNKLLHDNIAKIQNERRGVLYTRWGKKMCTGNGTELVYTATKQDKAAVCLSGFAGGPGFAENGSAANYLCLPTDPTWGHYNDNPDFYRGRVYGVEYEVLEFAPNLHNENSPCAVCRVESASTVLMIPGRNKCYGGWNTEYYGYLVANQFYNHRPTEYICLDAAPDVLNGGHENEDGALLYSVEAKCGSLRCLPYVNGRELTCVVCSK